MPCGTYLLILSNLTAIFYRTVLLLGDKMNKSPAHYGCVNSADALGQLVRAHRKSRHLTLETVSGLGNLSTRFLSEFERGKETAEIGKVLKALRTLGLEVIVQPRSGTPLYSTTIKKETQND